jgi:hypothetical protein
LSDSDQNLPDLLTCRGDGDTARHGRGADTAGPHVGVERLGVRELPVGVAPVSRPVVGPVVVAVRVVEAHDLEGVVHVGGVPPTLNARDERSRAQDVDALPTAGKTDVVTPDVNGEAAPVSTAVRTGRSRTRSGSDDGESASDHQNECQQSRAAPAENRVQHDISFVRWIE